MRPIPDWSVDSSSVGITFVVVICTGIAAVFLLCLLCKWWDSQSGDDDDEHAPASAADPEQPRKDDPDKGSIFFPPLRGDPRKQDVIPEVDLGDSVTGSKASLLPNTWYSRQ